MYAKQRKHAQELENVSIQDEYKINAKDKKHSKKEMDDINAKHRRCQQEIKDTRKKEHIETRNHIFHNKGNFNTLVTYIRCDTTKYILAPTPETGVMNWYQCVEKWHLEWLMEDIQD